MTTLERIRRLVGDDRAPYQFTVAEVREVLRDNGGSIKAAAADLRDLRLDRNNLTASPSYEARTKRLREEGRAFVMGSDGEVALFETGTIEDVSPTAGGLIVGVSTSENPSPSIFGDPRTDGRYVVPTFAEPSYIYIAIGADTLTRVANVDFPINQREAWQPSSIETEVLGGSTYHVFRSRVPLAVTWSGAELEIS